MSTTISSVTSKILEDYTSSSSSSSSSTTKAYSAALKRYLGSTDASDVTSKDIFSKISIDLGGDGKTISKDQLDSYISSAESGKTSVNSDELTALKTLQTNWNSIAGENADSMSYAELSKSDYSGAFDKLIPSSTSSSSASSDLTTLTEEATSSAYNKIINSALSQTTSSSSSTSSLQSVLNTLLTGTTDENDDANANLIATLTNLIAKSSSSSTIETEA